MPYSDPKRQKLYQRIWYLKNKEAHDQRSKDNRVKPENVKRRRWLLSRRRHWLNKYKLHHGCAKCGYNEAPEALDFHHVGQKDAALSKMLRHAIKKIIAEVRQCEVLCAICHRLHHVQENNERAARQMEE